MRFQFAWKWILTGVFISSSAMAEYQMDCEEDQRAVDVTTREDINYNYCIHHASDAKPDTVVYFFHQYGGSQSILSKHKLGKQALSYWEKKQQKKAPAIITVSMGSMTNFAKFGLRETMVQKVFPELEAKLGYTPKHRVALGISLGGWNALQVSMVKPDLFDKVVMMCPSIANVNPFEKDSVKEYIKRTGARSFFTKILMHKIRKYYGSSEEWVKFDPFRHLVPAFSGQSKLPTFMITANEHDMFGFGPDTKKLAELMKANRIPAGIHMLPGNHCDLPSGGLERMIDGISTFN